MNADCLLSLMTTAKCLPSEFWAGAWQGFSEAALVHFLLHRNTGKLSTGGSWQHPSLATPSSQQPSGRKSRIREAGPHLPLASSHLKTHQKDLLLDFSEKRNIPRDLVSFHSELTVPGNSPCFCLGIPGPGEHFRQLFIFLCFSKFWTCSLQTDKSYQMSLLMSSVWRSISCIVSSLDCHQMAEI